MTRAGVAELSRTAGDDHERLARVWLGVRTEPGDLAVARLLVDVGAEEAVARLAAGRGPAQTVAPVRPDREPGTTAARVLESATRQGLRWVCPGDDEWPARLHDLSLVGDVARRGGTPAGLWARGPRAAAEKGRMAVAVVGARASTEYGNEVAGEIAAELAEAGVSVISGAAYGIDAAAHRGALAVRGPTAAVLACGVDVAYPRGHDAMLARIAEQGIILSEAPPGDHPTKVRFLARNRLIAALADAVVVVEAAWRSGALNTLLWAGELQRPACGVPGPVTSALSRGVHHVLREHRAELVTNAAEVIELIAPLGSAPLPGASGWNRGERRPLDGLDPMTVAVREALPVDGAAGVDLLAAEVGLNQTQALAVLGRLLALGLAERNGAGWRLPRRGGLSGGQVDRTLPT